MVSTRAQEVAEVLWELKRASKIGTYTTIARRAGFSAGSSGRAMLTCLKTVRRDWPHLQWWRAVRDDGQIEKDSEHASALLEGGFEVVAAEGTEEMVVVVDFESLVMSWDEDEDEETADEAK